MMDEIRKKHISNAATLFLLFAVIVMISYLAWLLIDIADASITGKSGSGFVLLLFLEAGWLAGAIKSIVFILAFGSSTISTELERIKSFHIVVYGSAIGILLCVLLGALLGNSDIAASLYDNPGGSSTTSYEVLQERQQPAFVAIALWFGGLIASQFGLKLPGFNNG
ncbi:hypothetical protein [Parasphingorhabdus sp.]|uniref:hypothetical protein n=1 Tax=Parasphingorhabdus sp. TaxID=2709688 RepID=UPI0032ED7D4D